MACLVARKWAEVKKWESIIAHFPIYPNQGSKYRISGSYHGSFSYRISDIGGDIGDTRAYRSFISDTIYNEILITKS